MHSFPLWFDFLLTGVTILLSWQTWVILGAAGVVGFLWYKKNKKK